MILSWLGAGLILAGSFGTGYCICRERLLRIRQLQVMGRAFVFTAGEVSYSSISLPEVFLEVSEQLLQEGEKALGEVFAAVAKRLLDGSGQEISLVWQMEMGAFLEKTSLSEEEKKRVLSFPAAVLFPDSRRQQAAIQQFADSFLENARALLQTTEEKNRMTLAACLTCGAVVAILLI